MSKMNGAICIGQRAGYKYFTQFNASLKDELQIINLNFIYIFLNKIDMLFKGKNSF